MPKLRKPPAALPRALPGRQPERERFAECLDLARQGMPTLLLFEGEGGSGKTSLLDEIETSPLLPRRRIRVARIEFGDDSDPDPVGRAADLLTNTRRFARFGGRRRVATLLSKLVPNWIGTIPIVGDALEAVVVTTQAVRRRLTRGKRADLAEDIAALQLHAQRRPTALLIDDLHLIREKAADRLLRLLRDAEVGTRLLIVGTMRTPPPGAPKPVVRTLHQRLPADRIVHHRLGTLVRDELAEWMDVRFPGAPIPPSLLDFLLAESGGQPGAVQHLLDRLMSSGALTRGDSGWTYDERLGEEQLGNIEPADAYLGNLSDEVGAAVSAATVFGDEFDALALARLLDADELELEDQLAIAMRSGLLVAAGEQTYPDGDISSRYRFASSSLRAALHRNMEPARRNELESRVERSIPTRRR